MATIHALPVTDPEATPSPEAIQAVAEHLAPAGLPLEDVPGTVSALGWPAQSTDLLTAAMEQLAFAGAVGRGLILEAFQR